MTPLSYLLNEWLAAHFRARERDLDGITESGYSRRSGGYHMGRDPVDNSRDLTKEKSKNMTKKKDETPVEPVFCEDCVHHRVNWENQGLFKKPIREDRCVLLKRSYVQVGNPDEYGYCVYLNHDGRCGVFRRSKSDLRHGQGHRNS